MASLNWHDLFRKEDLNELCDCGIDVYSGNRLRQLIIEFARKQGDDVQVIVDSESLNYYSLLELKIPTFRWSKLLAVQQ